MKTGVVGIDLDSCTRLSGLELLKATGNNSGNILFTHAVTTHFPNTEIIGFSLRERLADINRSYSGVVIPAANWINSFNDWGFLLPAIQEVTAPLCCVGLGSQNTLQDLASLRESTIAFLKALSSRSPVIGIRGEHTREILARLDIRNTEIVGCPSMFPHLQPIASLAPVPTSPLCRLSISFTRYTETDPDHHGHQQHLARLAARFADSIVLQSEQQEINYLQTTNPTIASWLCGYYNVSPDQLSKLVSKMRFFSSQQEWVRFHSENTDLTISSRIHGCIASLLGGKPAFLLAHDQRTEELAEAIGIPAAPIRVIETIRSKPDLIALLNNVRFDTFLGKQDSNLDRLTTLYRMCGL